MKPENLVSICIATRDRAHVLAPLLARLEEVVPALPFPCEVIVVDNASTDGTRELLAQYAAIEHHRHPRLDRPGKSRALNVAIATARGNLLAFLDDDETPAPGWLEALVAFLEQNPAYDAAVGRILPPPGTDPALEAKARAWRTIPFYDPGSDPRDTETLHAGNMMLRRDVFDRIGGFDEALGPGAAGCFEDAELARRAHAAGVRIGYVPGAVLYHEIDESRLSDAYLRSSKIRSGRSRYAAAPGWASWKAIRHLLVDLPAYPVRALLGSPRRRRTRARIIESFEVLRLALRRAPRPDGDAPSPARLRRPGKKACFALLNTNRSWGGGEKWFVETAAALADRKRPLLLLTEEHSELRKATAGMPHPQASPAELAQALTTHKPAVVLCNARKDLQLLRRVLRGPAPPRIVLFRGIAKPLRDNVFRRPLWRALSRIIVNSDATGEVVRRSLPWFPEDRVTRVYHAVPFEPKPRVPSRDGTFRIGVVSRLVPTKAIDQLVEALPLLPEDLRWSLVIAGEGKSRDALEAQVAAAGLAGRVRFLGHVADVAPVYADLDVVAIPSLYEGFCFTAVEAALSGLPVVASGVAALKETVQDGQTGLLVPPKDPRAIASALMRLAGDPDHAAELGRTGQRVARQRFQDPALLDELDAVLERAATEEPVGRK